MMFWHEVDGALLRESAKLADPVRESIKAQVDIAQIIEQWNLSYPKGSEVTKAEAKAWAKVHIKVDNNELNKGLGILYAIGWIFGRDVATSAYAHARLNKAAPTDEALRGLLNIDWSKWTPGNNPGALLASPPGGLKSLLQRRGLDLQGLTNTLLNRIGTHLADALMSGASDTMLGKVLETVVGDPERALTIANTSMASAMSVSTRETYQEFGLAKMRWLALEPCSTCSGNAALGPVTPGEALFTNVQGDNITEPPAHPNCRCALAPYIDLGQFKYSASQARDARGRFSDGGAGASILANAKPSSFKDLPKPNPTDVDTDYAIRAYAGTSMGSEINSQLRKGKVLPEAKRLQEVIDKAPALESDMTFTRHVDELALGPLIDMNADMTWKTPPKTWAGTVLTNKGFTSVATQLDENGKSYEHIFDKSRDVKMNIIAPKGTKGIVGSFSENEFILSKGSSFLITGAKVIDSEFVVDMVVVDQNG